MNNCHDMDTVDIAETLARKLWRCFDEQRFRDALPLLSEDFQALWPNTRERNQGPENFIALNENYPGSWRCLVERVEATAGGVITVTRISDARTEVLAVSIFSVREKRIIRAEEFFGDVIVPPFDRSKWSERY